MAPEMSWLDQQLGFYAVERLRKAETAAKNIHTFSEELQTMNKRQSTFNERQSTFNERLRKNNQLLKILIVLAGALLGIGLVKIGTDIGRGI